MFATLAIAFLSLFATQSTARNAPPMNITNMPPMPPMPMMPPMPPMPHMPMMPHMPPMTNITNTSHCHHCPKNVSNYTLGSSICINIDPAFNSGNLTVMLHWDPKNVSVHGSTVSWKAVIQPSKLKPIIRLSPLNFTDCSNKTLHPMKLSPPHSPPPMKLSPPPMKLSPPPPQKCVSRYDQCKGLGWTKCCTPGNVCVSQNEFYAQCLESSVKPGVRRHREYCGNGVTKDEPCEVGYKCKTVDKTYKLCM